jgi:hypothetical protein
MGFAGVAGACARASVAMESNEMAIKSFLNMVPFSTLKRHHCTFAKANG